MGTVWDPTRCLVLLGVPEQQKFFSPSRGWRLQMGIATWALLAMVSVVAEPGAPEEDSEPRDVPFEGPPEEEEARVHGNKTEAELRAEAKSKQHVYTHRPKNPYCDVCNRSKMLKHYARKTDGSRHVVAEGFGDHIVADFVLIHRPVEQRIDGLYTP